MREEEPDAPKQLMLSPRLISARSECGREEGLRRSFSAKEETAAGTRRTRARDRTPAARQPDDLRNLDSVSRTAAATHMVTMEEQTAEVRRVQEECDKRQRVEDAYLALMDDERKYLKDRFDRLVERNREDGRDKPEELIRADRHPQPAMYIVRNQGHDSAIRKVDAQEPRLKESLFKDVAPNSTRTTKSEQVCRLTVLPARQPDRRGHKGEHIDRRGRQGHPQGTCGDTREEHVPRHRDGRRNRGGGGGLRPYAHVRAKECHPSRRFRDRAANKERNVRQLQLQCGPAN